MTETAFRGKGESLVKPLRLSHGTLTCRNLGKSRYFYESFLGLECVQHQPHAMILTLGRQFAIVCLQIKERAAGGSIFRHWGLDVESREEVNRLHALAHQYKVEFGLANIHEIKDQHGAYSFYLEDLDGNWWEIEHVGDATHATHFVKGDVDLERSRA